MKTRGQKIRLGIFIFTSSLILLFIVGYFTARKLFEKTDIYYVSYQDESVNGLEVGSPVKYLGIKVGTISDIKIDPKDITSIVVKLSLKDGTPVKEDSKAVIVSLGITGLKTIEIRGGTNNADFLEEESFIQPGRSTVNEITGKAEIVAEKAEKVLNNLLVFSEPENLNKVTNLAQEISTFTQDAGKTLNRLDGIVANNQTNINNTLNSAYQISESLVESSKNLQLATRQFNYYMNNDTLHTILGNAKDISDKLNEANIKQLIQNLANVVKQTEHLLYKVDDDINRSSQDLVESQEILKQTLQNLNEASRKINNNPAVLIRGQNKVKGIDSELKR